MSGIAQVFLLLFGFGVLVARAAVSGPPEGGCSTFPTNGITLVGKNSANSPAEDRIGEFTVTIREYSPWPTCVPVPGATVTVDFGACSPDIELGQVQTFPGVSMDCAARVVSVITNQFGAATFRILGGANNPAGNAAGVSTECAELRVDGVFLTRLGVAAIDQAGGLDGARPNDISVVIADVNYGSLARRSDFDYNDVITPGDLAREIGYVNSDRSVQNGGSPCP